MFCEPCHRERPTGRFCVLCGSVLLERPPEVIRTELDHVEWLLGETLRWDSSLNSRFSVTEFYERQRQLLLQALAPPPPVVSPPVVVTLPEVVDAPEPAAPVEPEVVRAPEPEPVRAAPREPVEPPPPPRPSRWQLTWKPFLHESLGWFLGAFLILSGALYLIHDAWGDMTSTTRALTIFGLLEAWSLGFVAWAAALSKKHTTASAGVGLRRIAALVAPLSVLALAPATTAPGASVLDVVLAWGALLVGSGVAATLAHRAARDAELSGAPLLAGSVGLTTLLVGVTPLLSPALGWLLLAPAALAAWSFRQGPRATRAQTLGSLVGFLAPIALLAARFFVAWGPNPKVLAGAVVSAALLATAALWLRGERSRGALGVAALATFVVTVPASFLVAAPACVLVCLLAAFASWQLGNEGLAGRGRWWLAGTWTFSFLAWQRADQLVPAIVWVWWNQLKVWLGYAAAPMPASYGSVYQSLFIVGSLLASAWVLRRHADSIRAAVWLRASTVGAGLSAALAMVGLEQDPRPALVTLPLLLAGLLVAALPRRRVDALAASALVGFLLTLTLATFAPTAPFAAVLPLAGALSAHLFARRRGDRPARQWLAGSALLSALLLVGLGPSSAGGVLLAALVAALAGRALHRKVFAVALLAFAVALWRFDSALVLSLGALGVVALTWARGRRWAAALPLSVALLALTPAAFALHGAETSLVGVGVVVAASLAALPTRRWWWAVAAGGVALALALVPDLRVALPLGLPWLAAAATAALLAVRLPRARPGLVALALVLAIFAVAPLGAAAGLWPGWTPLTGVLALFGFVLAASTHAVLRGRSWQGVLFSALSVSLAVVTTVDQHLPLSLAAALVLAATPSLIGWLTVPLGGLLLGAAFLDAPAALLACAAGFSVLALCEEWDWTWRALLNRRPVAWVASAVSALLVLVAALLTRGSELGPWVAVAALALPFVWVRATRSAVPLAAGVVLVSVGGPWWLAPLFAVAAGRALELTSLRRSLSLAPRAEPELGSGVLLAVSSLCAFGMVVDQSSRALPWAAALLLLGGGVLALRVALAAVVAATSRELAPFAVGALVALGALARHAPVVLRRGFGSKGVAYVQPVALVLAVLGALGCLALDLPPREGALAFGAFGVVAALGARATTGLVRFSLGALASVVLGLFVLALPAGLMLPVTVAAAGVLLGLPALLGVAVALAALDVQASVLTGAVVLAPLAWFLAVGAAFAAIALRSDRATSALRTGLRQLGQEGEGPLASFFFWPAFAVFAVLVAQGQATVLWALPLLLVTPRRVEHAAALTLLTTGLFLFLPVGFVVALLCLGSITLAALGSQLSTSRLAPLWRWAAGLVALLALVRAGVELESPRVAFAWASGAATAWVLLGGRPERRGWAWAATSLSLHVVLGSVGVWLSTGAPKVLILPWWAAGSAALALLRHLRGGRVSVWAFSLVSVVELLLGVSLLAGAQPREAVLSVVVGAALAFIAWRRVVALDEQVSAWVGQVAALSAVLALRVLGAGAAPGLTEAWVLLGAAAIFSGLGRFLAREGRPAAAQALRVGALCWPALGLLLVPANGWQAVSAWLLGWSVLGAWLGVSGMRKRGALLSALTLNLGVLVAAVGSGLGPLQLVLVPLGLTLLVLAWVFHAELSAGAAVQLRAWGMGLVYVAIAWEPLTVTSVPALMLCVAVCLGGVALGAVWRVRSYVVLGTGVLVTTVSATLIRSGIAEPRLGAIFLSLLGLAVVALMVVISTRRAELEERLAALRRTMATWTP